MFNEEEVLRLCGKAEVGYCGLVPEYTGVTSQDNEGVFSEVLVGEGLHDLCLGGRNTFTVSSHNLRGNANHAYFKLSTGRK